MQFRWLAGLLLCASFGAQAAYITDSLLVGLMAEPDANLPPMEVLSSGTPVQILQQQTDWAQVQLPNGQIGWLEKRFVTDNKPAEMRLLELQASHRQLQSKQRELQQQTSKLEQELSAFKSAAASNAQPADSDAPKAAHVGRKGDLPWSIWTGLILMTFTIGVLIGRFLEDRKQRNRHHGFRV